jgi:hypothetical protein
MRMFWGTQPDLTKDIDQMNVRQPIFSGVKAVSNDGSSLLKAIKYPDRSFIGGEWVASQGGGPANPEGAHQ